MGENTDRGRAATFLASVGIDDSCGSAGSANIEVHVNDSAVRVAGPLTGSSAKVSINVNVANKSSIRLVVTDAGNGNACDRIDWANARLTR